MQVLASVLLIALSGYLAKATQVSSCTQTSAPLPSEVDVLNCDTPPCTFYIDTTSTMTMKFNAPRYMENIAPRAYASVLGLNVTYPLGQDDACDGITNTPCPIAKGEYVEYTYGMYISAIFPEVGVALEFALVDNDSNEEPFVCFKVQLQLSKR